MATAALPAADPSHGFRYRLTADKTIVVSWPRHLLGYSTELAVKYVPFETARGRIYEPALYRLFGAELPAYAMDWLWSELGEQLNADPTLVKLNAAVKS